MSIQSLVNTQTYAENRRPTAKRSETADTSFQDRLARTAAGSTASAATIYTRMPKEGYVYSGVHYGQNGVFQEIYAEYTADSTPEDPIVRITGTSDSGPFDFTCHINNVDPSNTSYAELAALYGHLEKTGVYQSALVGCHRPHILPDTVDYKGNVTQKHNFISEIKNSLNQPQHIPTAVTGANELLALYQNYISGNAQAETASVRTVFDRTAFTKDDLLSALSDIKLTMVDRMKKSKEKKEEKEDWDRLMKYVDAWIESLREEADIEKTARVYAALKAAQADDEAGRKDLGDYLLEQLTEHLAN